MSGNKEAEPPARGPAPPSATPRAHLDPRIGRTRDALGDALVQLMQQKPFDEITVQDVLDHAGVSRTTFYTHFSDKQDLFLSDVEDFLELVSTLLTRRKAPSHRIAPVEELFAHVAEVRDFRQAVQASGKAAEVRELGIGFFARSIEERLLLAGVTLPQAQLRGTAHAHAGALFSLLDWWIAQGKSASPAEMDALFHRLVWQGSPPSHTKAQTYRGRERGAEQDSSAEAFTSAVPGLMMGSQGTVMTSEAQPTFISLEEALQAQKALRAAAGLGPEMFPVQAFVGMISDEVEALRRAGKSDEDIVALIRQSSSIEITAAELAENYATPEQRHGES